MVAEWKDIIRINKDFSVKPEGVSIKLDKDIYNLIKSEAKDLGKTPKQYFNERILCLLVEDIKDRMD